MLTLTRPLVAFDVETHAKVPPEEARIVEIGFYMLFPDDRPPKEWGSFVRPDLLIAPDTEAIHGISNAMVAGAPYFRQLAPSLAKGFTDCDFCGHNIKFDIRVLTAEMNRAGVPWTKGDARLLDSLRLWQLAEPRTLTDAVRRFLKREPSGAHRASTDAKDALEVAFAQLEEFTQLPQNLAQLHDQCFAGEKEFLDPDGKIVWYNGEAVLNFGKHGQTKTPLAKVPRSYLEWILTGSFSPEVKRICENALNGVFPRREATPQPAAVEEEPTPF